MSALVDQAPLRFYAYYFDIEAERESSSPLLIMKQVLSQWAAALGVLEDHRVAFLPYGLDDESVECLEAQRKGPSVLRLVDVAVNGYSLILDDLMEFMLSPQPLVESRGQPKVFGEYQREELIFALRNAVIAAG